MIVCVGRYIKQKSSLKIKRHLQFHRLVNDWIDWNLFLDNRASHYPCRLYTMLDEELVEPMEIDQINVTEEAKHKLALQEEECWKNMRIWRFLPAEIIQIIRVIKDYELWHERCERNKDIIFSIIICIIYI